MQVEVFPCTVTERPTIMAVLAAWGMAIDSDTVWLRDGGGGWAWAPDQHPLALGG